MQFMDFGPYIEALGHPLSKPWRVFIGCVCFYFVLLLADKITKITAESLTTNFISDVAYFQRYRKLYGLTGTLGGSNAVEVAQQYVHCR